MAASSSFAFVSGVTRNAQRALRLRRIHERGDREARHPLHAGECKARILERSQTPFGYRTVTVEPHGNKDKKKLDIEPKEAEIVRLLFKLYLFGDGKTGPLGIKDITSYLNAHGFTERNGKPFRIQFVHKMLTKVSYTGTHYFNRCDSRSGKPKGRDQWIAIGICFGPKGARSIIR